MKLAKTGLAAFLAVVVVTLLVIASLHWVRPQSLMSVLGCLAICGYGLYIVFCAVFLDAVRYGAVAIPIESFIGRCFHFLSGLAFIALAVAITWRVGT